MQEAITGFVDAFEIATAELWWRLQKLPMPSLAKRLD